MPFVCSVFTPSNPSGGGACGSWTAAIEAVLDVDDALVEDVALLVHRDDATTESEGRAAERIDRRAYELAQCESLGAIQINVRPSSGLGRETELLCRGRPVLAPLVVAHELRGPEG